MPFLQRNKVGIMIYVKPETYHAIDLMAGDCRSISAQCRMMLEEVIAADE